MTRSEPRRDQGGASTQTEAPPVAVTDGFSLRPGQDDARITRLAIDVLRRRWVLPILTRLCVQPTRFNQLQRHLGVSSKALADALRALERDGLVARTPPDHAGGTGSYTLTPTSADLQPALRALLEWARRHGGELEQSRRRFDEAAGERARDGQRMDG